MLPVLVSFGPITIRSFGLFLMLAFLACLFVIWKRTREEGLSEERVLDVFFLAILAFMIFGRIGFVIANWAVFQQDFGRMILMFRYSGLSFSVGLLAFSVITVFLARLFSLHAAKILDVFSLGLVLGSAFWYFGCFLDGCTNSKPFLPLIFSVVFVGLFAFLRFFIYKMKHSPDLYELAKRPGVISLWYLIFLCISSLISSYTLGEKLPNISILVLVLCLGTFIFRYFEFLKGVQWSSFPKMFLVKLATISKTGGRILRRD